MASGGKNIGRTIALLASIWLIGIGAYYGYELLEAKRSNQAIYGNLVQIASAGMAYIHNENVEEVSYPELLQGGYFSSFQNLKGESYESLTVKAAGGVLRVTTSSGDEVAFTY